MYPLQGGVVSSLAHGMGKMRAKTPDTPKPYDAEETPETSPDTSPETSPETSVPTGHTAPHVGQIVMYRSVLHQVHPCHVFAGSTSIICRVCRKFSAKDPLNIPYASDFESRGKYSPCKKP